MVCRRNQASAEEAVIRRPHGDIANLDAQWDALGVQDTRMVTGTAQDTSALLRQAAGKPLIGSRQEAPGEGRRLCSSRCAGLQLSTEHLLGGDAAEQKPTGSWTELAPQTPVQPREMI